VGFLLVYCLLFDGRSEDEMDDDSDGRDYTMETSITLTAVFPRRKEYASFVPLLGIYLHIDECLERKRALVYTPH